MWIGVWTLMAISTQLSPAKDSKRQQWFECPWINYIQHKQGVENHLCCTRETIEHTLTTQETVYCSANFDFISPRFQGKGSRWANQFKCLWIDPIQHKYGNDKGVDILLRILHRETCRKRLRRANHLTCNDYGGCTLSVKVPIEDGYDEFKTEDGVFYSVSKHLVEIFCSTLATPCCGEQLFDSIGF